MANSVIAENLLISVCTVYLMYRFMNAFFGTKEIKSGNLIFAYIPSFFVIIFIRFLGGNSIIDMICVILSMLLATIFYKASGIKRITAVLLVYVIGMACKIVTTIAAEEYTNYQDRSLTVTVVMLISVLFIELFAEKYIKIREKHIEIQGHEIAVFWIPIGSVIIIYLSCSADDSNMMLIAVILLFVNILVVYLCGKLLKSAESNYNIELLEREVEEYKNQLNVIRVSQKRIESFKHDMKHHLLGLKILVDNNELEKVDDYLESMVNVLRNVKEYVDTGNDNIDSILNYMIQTASDKNIEVKTEIKIGIDMSINFYDLNIVLVNLLENAITAANKSIAKEILVVLMLEKNILFFSVENSYNGTSEDIREALLSVGKRKDGHGYGLQNVKATVQKYSGKMEIVYSDEIFRVEGILYIDDEKVGEKGKNNEQQ